MSTARIISTRVLGTATAVGLVLASGLVTASAAQSAPTTTAPTQSKSASTPVPEDLVPPAGNSEVARFAATGVQIYQCTNGAWAFLEPAATLVGREKGKHKREQAIHFRGPSWQSVTDGSLVEAKSIKSSPVEGSIAQLLLQATVTRGEGVFGDVTYVQRLKTKGGVAPVGSCTDGTTQSVPYTADYRFFAATEAAGVR